MTSSWNSRQHDDLTRRRLTPDELCLCLAMHMSSDVLAAADGVFFYGKHRNVPAKNRWWVCTAVDGDRSAWSPTFSRNYSYRLPLEPDRGPTDSFRHGTFYMDPGTVVVAETTVLLNEAASVGNDLSRYGARCHFKSVPAAAAGTGDKALRGIPPAYISRKEPIDMTTIDPDDIEDETRYLVLDWRDDDGTRVAVMTAEGLRQWVRAEQGKQLGDIKFLTATSFLTNTFPKNHAHEEHGVTVFRLPAGMPEVVTPVVRTIVEFK